MFRKAGIPAVALMSLVLVGLNRVEAQSHGHGSLQGGKGADFGIGSGGSSHSKPGVSKPPSPPTTPPAPGTGLKRLGGRKYPGYMKVIRPGLPPLIIPTRPKNKARGGEYYTTVESPPAAARICKAIDGYVKKMEKQREIQGVAYYNFVIYRNR